MKLVRDPFEMAVSTNGESQHPKEPMMSVTSAVPSDKTMMEWSQSVKLSDLDSLYTCMETAMDEVERYIYFLLNCLVAHFSYCIAAILI